MCGRFVSTTGSGDLAAHFGVETIVGELRPSWNVAPTATVWVIRDSGKSGESGESGDARMLQPMRWGLVPSWADDPTIGNRMFNARVETLAQRPAYRAAVRRRRCIVPADGFYEWTAVSGRHRKQGWYFQSVDGQPLAMAGLWETWQPTGDADTLHTCTVVTTDANDVVAPIHDRMPLVLPDEVIDAWLDPTINDPDDVRSVVASAHSPTLSVHAVGAAVNNARNDGPDLIATVHPTSGDVDDNPRLL